MKKIADKFHSEREKNYKSGNLDFLHKETQRLLRRVDYHQRKSWKKLSKDEAREIIGKLKSIARK